MVPMYLNGSAISSFSKITDIPVNQNGTVWDPDKKLLSVYLSSSPVDNLLRVANSPVSRFKLTDTKKQLADAIQITNSAIIVPTIIDSVRTLRFSLCQLNGSVVYSSNEVSRSSGAFQIISQQSLNLSKGSYILRVENDYCVILKKFILH
jgi:hypothetical protein